MHIYLKFLFFFGIGFSVCILIINLLIGFAKSLGIRNKNDIIIRWNENSKPSLGGIGIFMSILAVTFLYMSTNTNINLFGYKENLTFFIGICLAFLMGLSDDAYNTRPFIKLLTQITCGALVVLGGNTIHLFGFNPINQIITIMWVVGIMNSVNLLDNMDGITTSVSISAFGFMLLIPALFSCLQFDYWTFLNIGFIGTLTGFLLLNKPPSKLFMGDSGSQLIGYILAFYSIKFLWNCNIGEENLPVWVNTFLVVLILSIPLIDTFTVIFNRLYKGKSPAIGGKDHTSHHLVYFGCSEKQVWLLMWGFSILMGVLALLMLYFYTLGMEYLSLIAFLPFYLLFYFLFRNTIKYHA